MEKERPNFLFLSLFAFSLTGGVEKVCKNFIYAISKSFDENQWVSYSMHDRISDLNLAYSPTKNYKAFGGRKFAFISASIRKAIKSKTIILSHVNLLLVAKLIAAVVPNRRFILFAHGIEIWGDLAKWKVDFLRDHVEIWAVSEFTRQRLIAVHKLAPSQIKVLNNSLSPFFKHNGVFERPLSLVDKYKINTKTPIVYTLNRLSSSEKYKGYDTVIKAISLLKKEQKSFTYLLAGKADAKEQARIEKLIIDYDVSDNVKLIGYVDRDDLATHFLLADVFIMPSKGEGFGIVFIEASAHGCQVIGGNIDGSADALLNGKLGQLIDPTCEIQIKLAIERAVGNTLHLPQQQQDITLAHFGFPVYMENVKRLLA